MLFQRYIASFVYLVFMVCVSLPSAAVCMPEEQKHACCCAENSSCNMQSEMDCCNVEQEDNDQDFHHAVSASLSISELAAVVYNQTIVNDYSILSEHLVSFSINDPPPNRVKVYLSLHKLLFYA